MSSHEQLLWIWLAMDRPTLRAQLVRRSLASCRSRSHLETVLWRVSLRHKHS